MTPMDELDAVKAKVALLETEAGTLKAQIAKDATDLATAQADIAGLTKSRDEAKLKNAELEKSVFNSVKILADEKAAHGKTQADLALAQVALQNPAFASAAARGSKTAIEEGSAEGKPATVKMTTEEALEKYAAIKDPLERAEYRKTHKEELGLD